MPNWNEVLDEINRNSLTHDPLVAIDIVRRKYLAELHQKTGRNVICYYSGWLQKPPNGAASINDGDKNGLMSAVHGLNKTLGLDLLLHTPGGEVAATESIVHYLRTIFNDDIRVVVPQIAMSAGTMIACSSKVILMGKQSNLGPIDPQMNGIPLHGVLDEFDDALAAVKNDMAALPIWQIIISKYHPTFLGECKNAINFSTDLATKGLVEVMFKGDADAKQKADAIVAQLNNHADTKTHSRHIHFNEALGMGLKIEMLEDDQDLQDRVLTLHHAYMHTLANTAAIKIIENHLGRAMVITVS